VKNSCAVYQKNRAHKYNEREMRHEVSFRYYSFGIIFNDETEIYNIG
jgi:hypothetical protein